MNNPAAKIIDIMREKKLTLGMVESATGGLISHLITNIPGSSDVFQGSIISYSNEIKMKIVGVKAETLKKYGAVSARAAEDMASGVDGGGSRPTVAAAAAGVFHVAEAFGEGVVADGAHFPAVEPGWRHEHREIGLAASRGESGGDISLLALRAFDAED